MTSGCAGSQVSDARFCVSPSVAERREEGGGIVPARPVLADAERDAGPRGTGERTGGAQQGDQARILFIVLLVGFDPCVDLHVRRRACVVLIRRQ